MFKAFVASIKAYIDAKVEHAVLKYHADNHGAGSRSMTHALMAKEHVLTETGAAIDEFADRADSPQPGDIIDMGTRESTLPEGRTEGRAAAAPVIHERVYTDGAEGIANGIRGDGDV